MATARIVAGLLILANVVFAWRSIVIALRANFALSPLPAPLDAPQVAIVVPARNEAVQIEQCVRSLLAQVYPHFDIIVVDDGSTDDTAGIVERLAREDSRVRLVRGEPLPSGWVGKPWALHQGVRYAGGTWLLFTDADTIHEPLALASALGYARARSLDAVSVLTEQIMVSPAEWMLLPSILYVVGFAVGSLAAINDPARENALFNGQYILVRRSAYDALGGHEALRGEIAEDLEFARRLKADGRFRAALVNASGLVRVRMYRSLDALWEGFVKNFGLGSRDNPALAWAGIAFLFLLSPGTPLALFVHAGWGLALAGLVAWLAAAAGMARFGLRPWLAFWLPLGIAATAVIATTSMLRHAGGGVTWRGRRYT